MHFLVPAYKRVKLKEGKKRDKYLDLARELKKQWNMEVTVISILRGAFNKFPDIFVQAFKIVVDS